MEDCSSFFHLKYLERYTNVKPGELYPNPPTKEAIEDAIEFAKLHVKAALEEVLESIPCLGSSSDIATYEEVEDAVLNSYPLDNIK